MFGQQVREYHGISKSLLLYFALSSNIASASTNSSPSHTDIVRSVHEVAYIGSSDMLGVTQARLRNDSEELYSIDIDSELFAEPSIVVKTLAELSGSLGLPDSRRLIEVETQADILGDTPWTFPLGVTLQAGSSLPDATFGSGFENEIVVDLLAGYLYSYLRVKVPGSYQFGPQHAGGVFKLVDKTATRYSCDKDQVNVPMAFTPLNGVSPLAGGTLARAVNSNSQLQATFLLPHLDFMMGGSYLLCYNPLGSFGDPAFKSRSIIVPIPMVVFGITSACTTNGCLANERWYCFFSHRAEYQDTCRVDMRPGAGRQGWTVNSLGASRMSWTAAWDDDTYSVIGGVYIPAVPRRCADRVTPTTLQPETLRFVTVPQEAYVGSVLDSDTAATLPAVRGTTATNSFSIALCFCPNFDGPDVGEERCNDPQEFVQPFGGVHFWSVRLCSINSWQSCGVSRLPLLRTIPQQPFALKLQCPPGGVCAGDSDNKIKFIVHSSSAIMLPSWDPSHICRQEDVREATNITWYYTESSNAINVTRGGTRRDYKAWYDPPLISTKTFGQSFAICYCDEDCNVAQNFFMVGVVANAESIPLSRWNLLKSPGRPGYFMETVRIVNKIGALTLLGGQPSPLTESQSRNTDTVAFTRSGIFKLISYDRSEIHRRPGDPSGAPLVTLEQSLLLDKFVGPDAQQGLDAACNSQPFSETLTNGPTSAILAKEYVAYVQTGSESTYYSFNGKNHDQQFIPLQTGTLSVCYCATLEPATDMCSGGYWMHAARVLIAGAKGGEVVILPTNFFVQIVLKGWGFSESDSLRAIRPSQSCSENDYTPKGVEGFLKFGCPGINGSGCQSHLQTTNLPAYPESTNSTGIYIERIMVGETNVTLFFTGDVVQYFQDGDAITIDEASILYDGKPYDLTLDGTSGGWSPGEREMVSKLSGMYAYADEPFSSRTRMLPNRASYVYSRGALQRNQLSLNVGWPQGKEPRITFKLGGGTWKKPNNLKTNIDILASNEVILKLCWGTLVDGARKYYGDAGMVQFVNPISMDDAGVHFTGQEVGRQAPVVLSISPARTRTSYSKISQPLVIRMLFRDIDNMLMPLTSGPQGAPYKAIDDTSSVPREGATQALCGLLFTEMWTNDINGFPLVSGCYYGLAYADAPPRPGDPPPGAYREYFIVFEPMAGLRNVCIDSRDRGARLTSCIYQFVVNGRVGFVNDPAQDVVSFYTMCSYRTEAGTPCGSPNGIVEYGRGLASRLTFSGTGTETQLGRIEVGTHGSLGSTLPPRNMLLEPDIPQQVSLDFRSMTLELRAYPRNPNRQIERSTLLQLFFLPLTAWNFQIPSCTAYCIPAANFSCSDGRGGATVVCEKKPTVETPYDAAVPMPRNLLQLIYPPEMDVLPAGSTLAAIIRLDQIDLPKWGFFPTSFVAQIVTSYQPKSASVVLTAQMFSLLPSNGSTVGMLLAQGPGGAGPKPFPGDRGNEILVRLRLGFTLHHHIVFASEPTLLPRAPTPAAFDDDDNVSNITTMTTTSSTSTTTGMGAAPIIRITLPFGYECFVDGMGEADPTDSQIYFQIDANLDGYTDNPKGQLMSLGTWSSGMNACTFTISENGALFFGQIFYFLIRVNNPWDTLRRDDARNIWRMIGIGVNGERLQGDVPFVSIAEEKNLNGWVGNLAILTALKGEVIQPSSFVASDMNTLNVWFRAVTWMPTMSYVVVDAPSGFEFFQRCNVSNLPDEYYEDYFSSPFGEGIVGSASRTRNLGKDVSCLGDRWNRGMFDPLPTRDFNRARIRVGTVLLVDATYGFRLVVRNPSSYDSNMHSSWRIYVQSPEMYPCAGSMYSSEYPGARVDSNPANIFDKSWGPFSKPLDTGVGYSFGTALLPPTSVAILMATIEFFPLSAPASLVANLRIIAPVGYEWSIQGFTGTVVGKTCPDLSCDLQIQPSIPVLYKNELYLPGVVLQEGKTYGFTTKMFIPDRPPTTSSNAFFVEIGYDAANLSKRLHAGILPAPVLKILHDARIFSLCNAAAYTENTMEFYFRMATRLTAGEAIVIQGQSTTAQTKFRCHPVAVPGTLQLPADLQCSYFATATTGLPVLILTVAELPLIAGLYGYRFLGVTNGIYPSPQDSSGRGPLWTIGTYSNIVNYPEMETIDKPVTIEAPLLRTNLRAAFFLEMPDWIATTLGRDDRPEKQNNLVFVFNLMQNQVFPGSKAFIAIRAPLGFQFAENCSFSFQVFTNEFAIKDGTVSNVSFKWPCVEPEPPSWCPAKIETWPANVRPNVCLGIGNEAKLTLTDSSFLAGKYYAFQVAVLNPVTNDPASLWAMDFGRESSMPFTTFDVRTFDTLGTSLYAVSRVVSLPRMYDAVTPVAITFTPLTEVPPRGKPWQAAVVEGSFVVYAPDGFIFDPSLKAPGQCDSRTVLEVAGRRSGGSGAFSFGPGINGYDVECLISKRSSLILRFGGTAALVSGQQYRLVAYLRNPEVVSRAKPWTLSSYKEILATKQLVPLDQSVLDGYPIGPVIPTFLVSNSVGEDRGDFLVLTISIVVQFGTDFRDGDSLTIISPPGFDLLNQGGPLLRGSVPSTCEAFRWPTLATPMPDSPPPDCQCDGHGSERRCTLTLTANEPLFASKNGVVVRSGNVLSFNISAVNPPGPPDVVEAYWFGEHKRRVQEEIVVLGASQLQTWKVKGQIRDLYLDVGSSNTRAGSLADLVIIFTPMVWGSVVEVLIHEPLGFDFSTSRLLIPYRRDDRASIGRIVILGGTYPQGEEVKIRILGVILGSPGGQTRMSIKLYDDVPLQFETAERLNFIGGFRVAGSMEVLGQRLWGSKVVAHFEGSPTSLDLEANVDVMLPLLPPLAYSLTAQNNLARVELMFSSSLNVTAFSYLIIRSEKLPFTGLAKPTPHRPYSSSSSQMPSVDLCSSFGIQILGDPRRNSSGQPKDYADVAPIVCDGSVAVPILSWIELYTEGDPIPDGLNLTLNESTKTPGVAIMSERMYRVRFWVRPSLTPTSWRVEASDGSARALCTNDAVTTALAAVSDMVLTVSAAFMRIPPDSALDLTINVRAGSSQESFSYLNLLLPPGLAPYGLNMQVDPTGSTRAVARLDVDPVALQAARTKGGQNFYVRIQTPSTSPRDLRWFVVAFAVDDEGFTATARKTGWGVDPGFGVQPLPITIVYPPLQSCESWLSIYFQVPNEVGGSISQITAPKGYQLFCPSKSIMSLPCVANYLDLPKTISGANVTLVAGRTVALSTEYSFLLGVVIAAMSRNQDGPPDRIWNVKILNMALIPVDATGPYMGPAVLDFHVLTPTLAWKSPPQHGEASMALLEVTFTRILSKIKSILFTLPDMYTHDVRFKNQVKCLNAAFPLAIDLPWLEFTNLGWLRIMANDGVSEDRDFLPVGTFQFAFPVRVPKENPTRTEWYLSLCSDYLCTGLASPSVVASFPIPNVATILEAKSWVVSAPSSSAHERKYQMKAQVAFVVGAFLLGAASCI